MNPEMMNIMDNVYDLLPHSQASADCVNDVLGLIDRSVNELHPGDTGAVWRELDNCQDFVDLIDTIALYCGIEATQILAIFCLDRGLANCQMEFHEDIHDEYLCSVVQTYKRLMA